MSIIKGIIASQIVDQFAINPGWREGMQIPLRLTPEQCWAILADTKAFKRAIAKNIESEVSNKSPVIGLELTENGGLLVKIHGTTSRWRFKK